MKKTILLMLIILLVPTVYARKVNIDNLETGYVLTSGDIIDQHIIPKYNIAYIEFRSRLGRAAFVNRGTEIIPMGINYNVFDLTSKNATKSDIVMPTYLGKKYIYVSDALDEVLDGDSSYEQSLSAIIYNPVLSYPKFKVLCDDDKHCRVNIVLEGNNFEEMLQGMALADKISFDITSEEYDISNAEISSLFLDKPNGSHIELTRDNFIILNSESIDNLPEEEQAMYEQKMYDDLNKGIITVSTIESYGEKLPMEAIETNLPTSLQNNNIVYGMDPVSIPLALLLGEGIDELSQEELMKYKDAFALIQHDVEGIYPYLTFEIPLVQFDITPKNENANGGVVSLSNGSISVKQIDYFDHQTPPVIQLDMEFDAYDDKLEVIPEVKGVEENPKTGLFNTLLLIAPIILLVYGSYKLYKLRLFKKM